MAIGVRTISWWDTLRLQLHVSVPAFLLGLVAPNRFVLVWLSKRGAGGATLRFLTGLRERYGSDRLWAWFPFARTLLVLDPPSIEAVLTSADNAADPFLKKRARSRFAPDALVISSGDEWRERRDFNETVLDSGLLHRHHDAFIATVTREVASSCGTAPRDWGWDDFQSLAERISHQLILGAGDVRPELTRAMNRMVRTSNVLLRDQRGFATFYDAMARCLRAQHPASTTCLMHDSAALLASGRAGTLTPVPSQIGFWFFVLKDAVELHVARTLVLIAAHPAVQARVRDEIRAAGPLDGNAIDSLRYLEACVLETLRLWTPVPLLLRRATTAFVLHDGTGVAAGEQLLIHAGSYHRDPRVFGDRADRFVPEAIGRDDAALYVFSAHRQECAGRSLVTFTLKTTLASLLARCRFELDGSPIDTTRIPYMYDHFGVALRALPDA
jgi:cytochrome P450